MFNNPLKKYQQGGQVSQEQQQMLAAFVEWLPKRVKEFQGMQPEQIVEALNGMSKSPEGQKQVQAYMQQFQKEMQNSKAGMFKDGGKLQDFICKHAKGGHVAGCDCNPIKGDNGIPGGMPATDYGYRVINRPNRPALEQLLDEDGSVAATRMINGADTTLTIPSKRGNMPMILSNNLRGANAPGKWMMRRMGEPGIMVEPRGTSKSWNADFDAAKVSVQTEEDGGKVNKAKDGEKLEDSAPERYYNEKGVPSELNRYTTRPGRMLYAEVPTPRGNINFEFNQLNGAVPGGLNLPIEYDVQTRSMLDDSGSVGQQQLPLYQMPYFSQLKAQGAAYQGNGGVVKGQGGIPEGIPSPGNVDLFGRTTPYSNPVSTQPLDSAKVKLNNGNLIFTDINGKNVSWNDLGNGNWTYRNGNDIMDFSTSQSEGFKPYNRFKAWNRATSGSTKLSEKDNNDLNNLKNKTKNRK